MDRKARRAEEVMDAVVRERGQHLAAYAYLLTGDLRDAEDLVQDALVKTFVRRRDIDLDSAEGYVRRVMLTTYVDTYRRRRQWDRVRHLLVRPDHDDGHDRRVEARTDVQDALASLSPQQRAVVVMRYYDDLTVGAIADRLGIADGTVKRYLSVAGTRLATLLGAHAPTADATDDIMVERILR